MKRPCGACVVQEMRPPPGGAVTAYLAAFSDAEIVTLEVAKSELCAAHRAKLDRWVSLQRDLIASLAPS